MKKLNLKVYFEEETKYFKIEKTEDAVLESGTEGLFIKELFHELGYSNHRVEVMPESVVIKADDYEIKLYLNITETHLTLSDSSTGTTHIRIKFDKEYRTSQFAPNLDKFIQKVYTSLERKTTLIKKLERINKHLEARNISIGIVLKSTDCIKFYLKKDGKEILYFEVDKEFNLKNTWYISEEEKANNMRFYNHVVEKVLAKFS